MASATRWSAVFVALFCGIAVAMNMGKLPISLPLLRAHFGLTLVQAGWVVSAFNTLAVLSAVFFGLVGDRLGALRFCLLGLVVSFAGTLLGVMSDGLPQILASRLMEGAGFIAVGVSAPVLVTVATAIPDQRFALTVWSCYMPAGAALVTLIAPFLLERHDWTSLWWLVLLLLAAAAVALALSRPAYALPTPRPAQHGEPDHPLMRATPWLLALAFGMYSVQFFAVANWLPTFLREQRGAPFAVIAVLTALALFANVLGNLWGGWLMQRHVRRGVLLMGANLIMGLCGAAVFTDVLPDAVRYLMCCLLTFAGGVVPASVLSSSALLARTPRQIGTLQGLYMQVSHLGQFVGPPAIAALVTMSGSWRSALGVTATASACGVLVGWRLRKL